MLDALVEALQAGSRRSWHDGDARRFAGEAEHRLHAGPASLHDELDLTTVMVTHDMAEALLLATRVLVMDSGRIVADETPAALLAGAGGDIAQALVDVPRAQARQLAKTSEGIGE